VLEEALFTALHPRRSAEPINALAAAISAAYFSRSSNSPSGSPSGDQPKDDPRARFGRVVSIPLAGRRALG
jgi:hypothetical protein